MHVVSLLNRKGGVGKSTIACQLARGLQLQGLDVLVVDTDSQGTASDWAETGDDTPLVVKIDRATLDEDIPRAGGNYDIVVVDGAAKASRMNSSAVKASDLVLIPVQPSAVDIWPAKEMVDIIRARQEAVGKPDARFLVSRAVVGTNLASTISEALSGLEIPLCEARIHQRVAYAEAMGLGIGVMDLSSADKATEEIDSLTDEVVDLLELNPDTQ
jgi:chromosome partitioning protein